MIARTSTVHQTCIAGSYHHLVPVNLETVPVTMGDGCKVYTSAFHSTLKNYGNTQGDQ
jgi:hypothetical protein